MPDVILAMLAGACVGSFLNVCIYRIPRGMSVVSGSSSCPECKKPLGILDLATVLSYILLRGRCRLCRASISPRYPMVELTTALLFLAAFLHWGVSWRAVSAGILFSILIAASIIDFDTGIIPDEIIIAAFILGAPALLLTSPGRLLSGLAGLCAAGIVMIIIALASGGGLGGGDVKLSAVIGFFLGWPHALVALFLAFLAGALAGVVLLASGRKGRKDAVPFGPYLALGGTTGALASDGIIIWYTGLF